MEYTQIENEWKESQRRQEYELELARGFRVAENKYVLQAF